MFEKIRQEKTQAHQPPGGGGQDRLVLGDIVALLAIRGLITSQIQSRNSLADHIPGPVSSRSSALWLSSRASSSVWPGSGLSFGCISGTCSGLGIAKLFSSGRMQPGPSSSGSHLASIVGPEAERISPRMTIGVGGEAIAAWFENGVDLFMGRKEPLCLPG